MNALPYYIYDLRHEAKLLGAFEEEVLSGSTRSTPEHWHILDYQKQSERILAQLAVL